MKTLTDDMAKRLRLARQRRFKSAGEAARAMGKNEYTYRCYENGSRGFFGEVPRLARFFGVSTEWLMTGKSEQKIDRIRRLLEKIPPDMYDEAIRYLEFLSGKEQ